MFYFAYGMNLNPGYMDARHMHERGKGVLHDWKLVFRGLANVEPAPGESVVGGLWEIDKEGLRQLDRREGYIEGLDNNLYDRLTLRVDNGDEQVEAVVYIMSDHHRNDVPVYPPGPGYLELIHTGCQHFHLSEDTLWKAVRESCESELAFKALRNDITREVTRYA